MQLVSSSAILYAPQRYWQEMESIWEQVHLLPEGQDKVVMSQLWQFGKTSAAPTPKEFPALVAHGFLVEQLVDGRLVWGPVPPSLKEFWRLGITLSHAHGYTLQPHAAFQANLQATLHLHRPAQSQAEPLLHVVQTSKNEPSHSPEAGDLEPGKATVKLAA
jgi:hypothetical protein